MVWPPSPSLLEFSSHFFQNSLTKNFKNNFFTVFNLLAHWHLFAFDCFRAKISYSKLLDQPRPPPLLEEYHKKQKKNRWMASLHQVSRAGEGAPSLAGSVSWPSESVPALPPPAGGSPSSPSTSTRPWTSSWRTSTLASTGGYLAALQLLP